MKKLALFWVKEDVPSLTLRRILTDTLRSQYRLIWYTTTQLSMWCQQNLVFNLTGHPEQCTSLTNRSALECPHSLPPKLRMSTNPLEKDFDNNGEVSGEAIVMRNSIGKRRNERWASLDDDDGAPECAFEVVGLRRFKESESRGICFICFLSLFKITTLELTYV